MDRRALITALTFVVLSITLSSRIRAGEYLLRWIPPPEEELAGYMLYLASGCAYPDRHDIGLHSPDPGGIASFQLVLPDEDREYEVLLTAYSEGGAESAYSNAICVRTTGDESQSCAPRPDCRRPPAPTELMLDLWYLESVLAETASVLRLGADQQLMRELDKLDQIMHKAKVWVNADEKSLRTAMKSFAKVVPKLRSALLKGADPTELGLAEDVTVSVLRSIAQRAVNSVFCTDSKRCPRRRMKLQERIWKGDARLAKGRKISAASHYAGVFIRARKL